MRTSMSALLTIFGMACVTYLTRVGGLWLTSRLQFAGRFKAWVEILPGTILLSIVAPTVFSTGLAETGAALATVLVAIRTRNILLSMVTGVLVVVGLRLLQAHV